MTQSPQGLDIAELCNDIHGQELSIESDRQPDAERRLRCDFCGATLSPEAPFQLDVIRNYDMDNLEQMFGPLNGWWADAVRCSGCAVDGIYPPTDGWEEALVTCTIVERTGVFSLDTADLRVVDYSPGPEGYMPPPLRLSSVEHGGLSLSRWSFIHPHLSRLERTRPNLYEREPLYQYYRDRLDEFKAEGPA